MLRSIALAIALLLVGCSEEPRLKADTEADFNSSFDEVTKRLRG